MAFYVFDGVDFYVHGGDRPTDVWNSALAPRRRRLRRRSLRPLVDGRPVGDPIAAPPTIAYALTSSDHYIGTYQGTCALPLQRRRRPRSACWRGPLGAGLHRLAGRRAAAGAAQPVRRRSRRRPRPCRRHRRRQPGRRAGQPADARPDRAAGTSFAARQPARDGAARQPASRGAPARACVVRPPASACAPAAGPSLTVRVALRGKPLKAVRVDRRRRCAPPARPARARPQTAARASARPAAATRQRSCASSAAPTAGRRRADGPARRGRAQAARERAGPARSPRPARRRVRLRRHEVRAHRLRGAASSGATCATCAPRRRSAWSSSSEATRNAPRSAAMRRSRRRAPAVGSRHSTWVPRPACAASRFVTLHAPPSTYSRSPMRTGEKTHGIAHDAQTASATRRRRCARRAEDHAAPAAAVDRADAQPPVEARAPARDARAQAGAADGRGRAARRGPRRAPARRPARRARAAAPVSGALAAQPTRAASRTTPRSAGAAASSSAASAVGSRRRRASASVASGRGGRRPGGQPRGDDRAADVPTKASTRRKSTSAASSIPASTPCIQASPTIPPPASTRTSGRSERRRPCAQRVGAATAPAHQTFVRDNVRASPWPSLADQLDHQIHIGPRVRALREAMDLSLRDLAERTGVSARRCSRQVERGETSPTLAVASRIASGLELRLSQLLRLDEADSVVDRARAPSAAAAAAPPATSSRSSPRRCPASAPSSAATSWRPAPRPAARATRRCTSPAAARSRSSSAAPSTLHIDGAEHELARGRHRHLRRRPGPPLREPRTRRGRAARRRQRRSAPKLRNNTTMPKSLFDKIWEAHEVAAGLIYIDLHLVHEVTSPQAFDGLRLAGRPVRRPGPHGRHRRPQRPDRRHAGRRADQGRAQPHARSRRSSATARSSASRSTRWAPSTRASCTSSGPSSASPSRA